MRKTSWDSLKAFAIELIRKKTKAEQKKSEPSLKAFVAQLFRSRYLIQLRDTIARDQGQRRYHDCAGDAHRRSCRSADWCCLDAILSRPSDTAGVLPTATGWRSSNCLWSCHGTSNEIIANYLFKVFR